MSVRTQRRIETVEKWADSNAAYPYGAVYTNLEDDLKTPMSDEATLAECLTLVTRDRRNIGGGYSIAAWVCDVHWPVVGYTRNGREIRRRADGQYEVQPPQDNYWVSGATPHEVLCAAGWNF